MTPTDSPEPKPRPMPTPTSGPYWSGLRRGVLLLQRCGDCSEWIFYPRSRCPRCLSDQLSWHPASGRGSVHTFAVAAVPTAPAFADEVPQLIAVVQLEEGPRVTSTLLDVAPQDVRIGMPVTAVFEHGADDLTMLRFRPSPQPWSVPAAPQADAAAASPGAPAPGS
jgi:uncharacterized protein